MVNNQRIVRFAECVEEITSSNKPAASSSERSAWSPDETSLFIQHQSFPQRLDLAPRQPLRSLDSILTDALRTCEHFAIPLGNEDVDATSSSSSSSSLSQHDEGNGLTMGLPSSFFSLTNNDDDAASVPLPPLPTQLYRRRLIPLRSSCLFSQAM